MNTNGNQTTELLAPAGDMECFKAAIAAGADAVYLGGQRFGARAFAGNFDADALLEAIKLAHFFGKKVYLTVNTLTKDEELKELVPWLTPFYEAGLDGLIIQDMGVLAVCREAFPGMLLHASTQMTVTESKTALYLKSLGVSRIVPARELSLNELIAMKQETGMELETFIHGALCYAYSGQCLFSSMLGGRSGNRGRCAQPCRLPYEISQTDGSVLSGGKKEAYPLSLKDLCVLPLLPKLIDAGIDSFKIEGRMKSPEYVAGVTALYRKYIDLYRKAPALWKVEQKDLEMLSHLYVRTQLSSGYYEKHNGRDMVTLEKPGYAGCEEDVLKQIREKYLKEELTKEVNLCISLQVGKKAVLNASCEDAAVQAEGMEVMAAQKKPLTEEDIRKQLRKTGGSHFTAGKITIETKGAVFLPVSALNDLRRQALELLYDKMTQSKPNAEAAEAPERNTITDAHVSEQSDYEDGRIQETHLYASALNIDQASEILKEEKVKRLYLSADAVLSGQDTEPFCQKLQERKEKDPAFTFFLTLPVILRSYSKRYLQQLDAWMHTAAHDRLTDGIMAGSMSGLLAIQEYGWKKKVSVGHTVSIFNRRAYDFFMENFAIDSYTASLELNRREVSMLPAKNQEMVVYGRIPMMISANCVKKTGGLCKISHTEESLANGIRQQDMQFVLTDRYQAQFPVLVNCRHCMNTIYNSVPLSLHQYLDEIKMRHIKAVRLDFTDESAKQTQDVLAFFAGKAAMPPAEYTTGHYKKGVQ